MSFYRLNGLSKLNRTIVESDRRSRIGPRTAKDVRWLTQG